MKIKNIIVIHGEPNSIFSEVLAKYFCSKEFKKNKMKIIIIGSKKLIQSQIKHLGYNLPLTEVDNFSQIRSKKKVNIINVDYKFKKKFQKISKISNKYINDCFRIALEIVKQEPDSALLNGPVSKKSFLAGKYNGITEYLSKNTNSTNEVMLIYNKNLSVSPITTHIPFKKIPKKINEEKIINNCLKINKFYKNSLKKNPKIAILGLNPHCESNFKNSEEKNIILPAIKKLKKKKCIVKGPFATDTFFIKKNIANFDVVIGMYHDQVLTPIKSLFNFNAINLTLGLPFLRASPDHGPNEEMMGKNISDASSIYYAMNFFNNLK